MFLAVYPQPACSTVKCHPCWLDTSDLDSLNSDLNLLSAKDVLSIDFTLSNAKRFYSSKGNPLALKGLKNYLP